MDYNKLIEVFKSKFEGTPRIFRSPGRINVIGEHTDYNEGFVLPAAVDKEVCLLAAPCKTDAFSIYAIDHDEEVTFTRDSYKEVKEGWAQYVIGIVDQLKENGLSVSGIECAFSGNIPMGAGMSSSAALECATIYAFNALYNLGLDKWQLVKMAKKAENDYVGVNCGIMDQFSSVFSKSDYAVKLDCRDLSYESFSLNLKGYQFVLVDSMVKHSLANSAYNVRRQECEKGVAILQHEYPEIRSLRDVAISQVFKHRERLEGKVYQRCKYIVEEIERVAKACQALTNNDMHALGELLYETHDGLQHEFEISCEELDFLVDFTRDKKEILGARIMGGGFGGCTINLVEDNYVDRFCEEVTRAYKTRWNKDTKTYRVKTANGTSEIVIN